MRRISTTELIGDNGGVLTTAVATGEEAVRQAENTEFDCAVVTPPLEDMTVPELVEKIQKQGGGLSFQLSSTPPADWTARKNWNCAGLQKRLL